MMSSVFVSMFSPVVASNAGIADRFQVSLHNLPRDEDGRCSLRHTSSTETTVRAIEQSEPCRWHALQAERIGQEAPALIHQLVEDVPTGMLSGEDHGLLQRQRPRDAVPRDGVHYEERAANRAAKNQVASRWCKHARSFGLEAPLTLYPNAHAT